MLCDGWMALGAQSQDVTVAFASPRSNHSTPTVTRGQRMGFERRDDELHPPLRPIVVEIEPLCRIDGIGPHEIELVVYIELCKL